MEMRERRDSSAIDYLDAVNASEHIQAYKRRAFELLDLKAGYHVLDIGCGPGDDVRALAQMVGSEGRVVGVDSSETMIAEARKRSEGLGLPVDYRLCDAHKLVFADNTFDACRADKVFNNLRNPGQVLAEMIRVCRSKGRIVISDIDSGMSVVDSPDRALARKILNFACDKGVRNGWIGRQLYGLFRESGLTDIIVIPGTIVHTHYDTVTRIFMDWVLERAQEADIVSASEAANWLDQLEDADRNGRFFMAMTGFIVRGVKPLND